MMNQNPDEEDKYDPNQEPPLQAPNLINNEHDTDGDMEYSHSYNQPYSDLGGSPQKSQFGQGMRQATS